MRLAQDCDRLSRRKDRERFLQMKQRDPAYAGFRGVNTGPAAPSEVVSVVCSVCRRKRNVPSESLPGPEESYVCLQCQEEQAGTRSEA